MCVCVCVCGVFVCMCVRTYVFVCVHVCVHILMYMYRKLTLYFAEATIIVVLSRICASHVYITCKRANVNLCVINNRGKVDSNDIITLIQPTMYTDDFC